MDDVFTRFIEKLDEEVQFARKHPAVPRECYAALATVLGAAKAAARPSTPDAEGE